MLRAFLTGSMYQQISEKEARDESSNEGRGFSRSDLDMNYLQNSDSSRFNSVNSNEIIPGLWSAGIRGI